jgi:hypothetical protein
MNSGGKSARQNPPLYNGKFDPPRIAQNRAISHEITQEYKHIKSTEKRAERAEKLKEDIMYYYDKETATNTVNIQLENFRKCIEIINEMREVIGKFDGKVINKKFETALREHTGEIITVKFSYHRVEIELVATRCGKSRVHPVESYPYFPLCINALEGGTFESGYYKENQREQFVEVTEKTPAGNDRLIAENMLTAMNKAVKYYEKRITENSEALKHVDEYAAKVAEMERLEKELREIPNEVRRYFDFNVSVRHD